MNKLFLSFLFCFTSLLLNGQITVTPKILPSIGDVYTYSIDTTGAGIVATPSGPNQVWDFSFLKAQRKDVEKYVAPNTLQGFNSFPTSNLGIANQGSNLFLRVTNKNVELLGTFISGNPIIGGPNVLDKPATILRTPLDYLDTYDYETTQQFAISGKLIPDSLTMGISIDSIRIVILQNVKVEVDGWGTVKLPASSWNVLRQKQTTNNNITVEAKLPFVGWIDISALAGGFFGGALGAGNSITYLYISDDTKGHVASVMVDSLGKATDISFKAQNVGTKDKGFEASSFKLESKIADNAISLTNVNAPSANYQIEMVSILGSTQSSNQIFLAQGSTEIIKINNQSPARYELLIRNSEGELVWKTSYVKF